MGETISRRGAAAKSRRAKTGPRGSEPTVRRAAKLASDLVILVREPAPDSAGEERQVEVARVVDGRSPHEGLRLVLSSGRRLEVPSTWWEEVRSDLKDLVREELAPLDVEVRERVMQTLIEATAGHDRCSPELRRWGRRRARLRPRRSRSS